MTSGVRFLPAFLLLFLSFFPVGEARGAPWSGILDPSRAIDWSSAGIPGGIPSRSAVCATIDASQFGNGTTDATAAFQSAIDACPSGQVVYVPAGAYKLTNTVYLDKGVVLRGAGVASRIEIYGQNVGLQMGAKFSDFGPAVALSGSYSKGAVQVRLAGSGSFSAGQYVVVDELNPPYVDTHAGGYLCEDRSGNGYSSGARCVAQMNQIASVSGSTITLQKPLYADYSSALSPRVYAANLVENAGLERLFIERVDNAGTMSSHIVALYECAHCWVKDTETHWGKGDHYNLDFVYASEIDDNFLYMGHNDYGSDAGFSSIGVDGGQSYGVNFTGFGYDSGRNYGVHIAWGPDSDNLVQNNILDSLRHALVIEGPGSGNVLAYNYVTNGIVYNDLGFNTGDAANHGVHPHMNLWEGNYVNGRLSFDYTHGSGSENTVYRNVITHGPAWKNGGKWAVDLQQMQRDVNVVGNVLGLSGMGGALNENGGQEGIYRFGRADDGTETVTDSSVAATVFLHGNYDYVTSNVAWDPGTADHSLPSSFYLPSKPSWFGGLAWPAFGPDPNSPARLLNGTIPAKECFFNQNLATGGVFNPDACYAPVGGGGAPPWSGILDPSRAIDWSQAGVVGGVPNRTTVCAALAPGATAAQINAAIASCPSGQVVALGAGTYNLTTGLVMKAGVTVRGAGADQTQLIFTGADPCGGLWSVVCFKDDLGLWGGSAETQPGGSHAADWTGGYVQGSTQIVLSRVGSAGLSVGQYIYLDQANTTSDNGNLFVCDTTAYPCSLEGGNGARDIGGQRAQVQVVKITAINGNAYTITPGIYSPNWRAGLSPGAWWSDMIQGAGIENLTIDHTNSGESSGIGMENAFNCWVKGVRSLNSNRNHVWMAGGSSHNTVQDSYFYGTKNAASQSYGVEVYLGSDNLVVNNIFHKVTTPHMRSMAMGNVTAYNYSINDYYYVAGWLMTSMDDHNGGVEYDLFEGNNGAAYYADLFHGTGGMNTAFRNRLPGWETGKDNNLIPIRLDSYKRYENLIGNVLGTAGIQTAYEHHPGGSQSGFPIYALGGGNSNGNVTVPDDPLGWTTSMRWGNWDTVTSSSRFVSSEVPSGIGLYANAVPAGDVLPASFYSAARPTWWPAGKPWPATGPDVGGGNVPGVAGHSYTLPAQDCYANVMGGPADGSGSPLSFNAAVCYGGGGGGDVTPPGVAIASPANGATVSGTIAVSGTAADNVSVSNVAVSIDGGAYSLAFGTASWSFSLDTTKLSNAAHAITARATDSSGNAATAAISVTVNNAGGRDGTPPSVSISTPGDHSDVSGTVTLTASASDDVGVARVDFYDNGALIVSLKNPPYATSWKTANKRNGSSHTLTATAFDAAGNQGTASVTVRVSNPLSANAAVPGLRTAYAYPSPAVAGQDPVIRALLGWADGVEVSIYDMSGRLVSSARLDGTPTGILNGEYYYDYPWTGAKSSGVYFAVIHGKSSDGTIVRARVRFAVVR